MFHNSGRISERTMGSRVGVVVRALAFHQCVPGSIPGPGVICGLSLLVLYSAPRGFSPGTPVFPSPQKPTFDLIWFDLFDLQSPQLVQHSCSARMIWDSNKVIIIIIIIIIIMINTKKKIKRFCHRMRIRLTGPWFSQCVSWLFSLKLTFASHGVIVGIKGSE